jgi:hypothetical protein
MSLRTNIIAYFGAISLSICCSAYSGGGGGPRGWVRTSFRAEIFHEASQAAQLRRKSLLAVSPWASILAAHPSYERRIGFDLDIITERKQNILRLSEQVDTLVNPARGENLLGDAKSELLRARRAYYDINDILNIVRAAERFTPQPEMREHSEDEKED